jgi:hypothetical protein
MTFLPASSINGLLSEKGNQTCGQGTPITATCTAKGSRKNKFAVLGVEASGRQGAKTEEYLDIPCYRNAARRDAATVKM